MASAPDDIAAFRHHRSLVFTRILFARMRQVGGDSVPVLRLDSAIGFVELFAHIVRVARCGDPLFILRDRPALPSTAGEITLFQSRERGADRVWALVDGSSYL